MFRGSLAVSSRISSRNFVGSARHQLKTFSVPAIRRYSSETEDGSNGFPKVSEKQAEELANNPLIQKLSNSPKALEALKKTGELLRERGYANQGGQPSVWAQMKLLSDSKVREQLTISKWEEYEGGLEGDRVANVTF